jgi:thioredoxin reductase (NADPH)
MSVASARLRVLSRQWCHLCDELRASLAPIAAEFVLAVEVVDVDAHPELEAQWDEKVPVLLLDGAYVCHYHLDEAALRAQLAGFPVNSAP